MHTYTWLSRLRICLQCRRHGRREFDSWVKKIPWRRKWQPTPGFLPGESHGQRSLAGYSPRGHKRVGHNWATKHAVYTYTYFHTNAHTYMPPASPHPLFSDFPCLPLHSQRYYPVLHCAGLSPHSVFILLDAGSTPTTLLSCLCEGHHGRAPWCIWSMWHHCSPPPTWSFSISWLLWQYPLLISLLSF